MILTLIAFSSLTAACNTMECAGQDIKRGGEKLEEAAEENKNY
jgi:predicted small secreted protein